MRMDPLVRYQKVCRLLACPTGATVQELMEGTGSSRPTVYRLLSAIESAGEVLEKEDLGGRQVRYRLYDASLKTRDGASAFRIAKDELIAIQFVRRHARLFRGTELEQDIDNVFRKIECSIDPKHYRLLKRVDHLFLPYFKGVKDYTSGKVTRIIDTLANAILLERICEVRYDSFSSGKNLSVRLAPLHFFEHNGGLYLFAQAEGMSDVRMYAVERFRKAELTEKPFAYPADFDPIRRLESTFTVYEEEKETTFRIRFSAQQAPYIAERRWARKQKIETEPDGSIVLTMKTMGRWDVIRWVLGYGPEAEVLEPEEIREEITKSLVTTLKRYRQMRQG